MLIKYDDLNVTLTGFKHLSVNPPLGISPLIRNNLRFYRGLLLANNSNPDNTFNFYALFNFKSQRLLQPNLVGNLVN